MVFYLCSLKNHRAHLSITPLAIKLWAVLADLVMNGLHPVLNPIKSPQGLFFVMGLFSALLASIGLCPIGFWLLVCVRPSHAPGHSFD